MDLMATRTKGKLSYTLTVWEGLQSRRRFRFTNKRERDVAERKAKAAGFNTAVADVISWR